ncbi:MAG: hypothetical protein IPJ31_11865 [Bacteroidetes bacterium]|nr:hypothetical protein [Bacteroidota bacterium]MBP6316176.1 hypothetical protein [Chitinophagaceae bacterium]
MSIIVEVNHHKETIIQLIEMRKLIFGFIFCFTILLMWINLSLYTDCFTPQEKQDDILKQLHFIEAELKTNNLANRMQDYFPEGFVFANALYGLSWCEMAGFDSTPSFTNKALNEALFAYGELNSNRAKNFFDEQLKPEYGIFYMGWKNYLLSKVLQIDTNFEQFTHYKSVFSAQCQAISMALSQSSTPFLESYKNQTWPADMFAAMASLKNYDKLFGPTYELEIAEWIKKVRTRLDPRTNLIPHRVESDNGRVIEGSRGSSISLIIRLLAEIDSIFAREQFQLYKSIFVTTTFGLPSVREYPTGQNGKGDIDSGPVICGIGFSGTIVSIGSFSMIGDFESAQRQYNTINAFGFATSFGKEKKYVFGLLPIADAFIAWGRATDLKNMNKSQSHFKLWGVLFHLFTLLILTILWLLYFSKVIISKFRIYRSAS